MKLNNSGLWLMNRAYVQIYAFMAYEYDWMERLYKNCVI